MQDLQNVVPDSIDRGMLVSLLHCFLSSVSYEHDFIFQSFYLVKFM